MICPTLLLILYAPLFCQEFVADPDDYAGSDYVCYVDGEAINMNIEDGTYPAAKHLSCYAHKDVSNDIAICFHDFRSHYSNDSSD